MTPAQHLKLGVSLLALIAAVLFGVALLHAMPPPADARQVDIQWHYEAPGAVEQLVQLPHRWPRGAAAGRYRGSFVLPFVPEQDEGWELYLLNPGGNLQARLNGVALNSSHAGDRAAAGTPGEPLRLQVPAALLRPGSNQVILEMQGATLGGFLGSVYLAPAGRLAAFAWYRYSLKHTALLAIVVSTLLLGVFSLVIGLARRQDPVYIWNTLTCLCGAGYTVLAMTEFPRNTPLPPVWIGALANTMFAGFVIAGAGLGLSHHHKAAPWPRWLAWATCLLLLAAPLLAAAAVQAGVLPQRALLFTYLVALAVGSYTGWVTYLEPHWQTRDTASFWLLCGAACMAAVSFRDALVLLRLLSPEQGLWFMYAAPMPLAVFNWLMLRRFIEALRETEHLNRHLEERVAQREAEIARNYEALRQAGQVQAIASERERIFGELHDGLGGTLMSALSSLSNQDRADSPVARSLQSALDDLRLTLVSLDPAENSLRAALAPLRERLASACADTGVALHFQLEGITDDFELPKPQLLQLLRILQEAAGNALRHARARQLHIVARVVRTEGGADLELQVDDDGIGFDPQAAPRSGHYGLTHQRRRAATIGARIEWQALQPGMRVQLRLPLATA